MSLLNLSLAEFLAVFLPVCAAVVALYLYDRSHRRQIVSTLRFFQQITYSPVFARRKKIQQPWSLLLQLVCLALLFLAIAELQLGRTAERVQDHVLILETSAWMNAADRSTGASLMQVARRRALDYLRAVPSRDRVTVVRADQLATPVTPLTRNRRDLEAAIRASQAGSTALNLSGALELARALQQPGPSGAPSRRGEIILVGSGRAMKSDLERLAGADFSNVRAILLGGEPQNCGIRKLAARRLPGEPVVWEVDVGTYNYGTVERRSVLRLTLGARVGSRSLAMPPHSAVETSFRLRSLDGGLLEAVLDCPDDYRADNRASIELPGLKPLKIQVFTTHLKLWKPLLTASPFLDSEFHHPREYTPTGSPRRLVILDGFRPATPPEADAIWIAPEIRAGQGVALQVRRWNVTHPIAAGLHNKDVRVTRAAALEAKPDDVVVAESDRGPVLVASSGGQFKKAVFGFHPLEEGAENHLVIPLLFANLVRWVSPDLFRAAEISAGAPGLIELETAAGTRQEQVQVTSPQIRDLPFTLVGNRLRLFVGRAGTVRVTMPERELVYTLNLPEVGDALWTPPPGIRLGVPPATASPLSRDLWPWLAVAGALGLLLEWILYGRRPEVAAPAARGGPRPPTIEPAEPPAEREPAGQEVRS